MAELSLDELKAQNEVESDQNQDEYIEVDPDTGEPIKSEVEDEIDELENDEAEEETEIENWQAKEDDTDGEKPKFNADSGWKAQRLKTSALKAENREQAEQVEALRAEIEALKVGQTNQQVGQEEPPPTLEQFDHDETLYQKAMFDYTMKQVDSRLQSHSNTQQQTLQQQEAARLQSQSVDSLYNKAAELVNSNKITGESWQNADRSIRQALSSISNGNGDAIADQLIATLNNNGEGGEKAWYYIGNNPSKLNELIGKFNQDPSGLQASMFLGSIQRKAAIAKTNNRSSAPPPAKSIKGDKSVKGSVEFKAYNKATDLQERIDIKNKARISGVDTSKW